MSKIQISELNLTTSEFNQLNDGESGSVVGGGNVNNNQSNNNGTYQSSFAGLNLNITNQSNTANISNYSYKGYGYYLF
jgi:hypothetical protein